MELTSLERQELRRVFCSLVGLAARAKTAKQIERLSERKRMFEMKSNSSRTATAPSGRDRASASRRSAKYSKRRQDAGTQDLAQLEDLNTELQRLQKQLSDLEARLPDGIGVTAADLREIHRRLGVPLSAREADEMIWEVDEELDQRTDWAEFLLMFERSLSDETGLEPSKLFHTVQFLVYDRQEKGSISVDDASGILFGRFGRDGMENKLQQIFGDASVPKTINFAEFLHAMEKTKMDVFLRTRSGNGFRRRRGRRS